MKDYIHKHFPAYLSRPIISFGQFIKRQERAFSRFFKYGNTPFFKKISVFGLSFWILLRPTKNGCIDEIITNSGTWEPEIDSQLKKILKKNDVFVDIGANIGYHSLFVASCLQNTGKIYSFEPIKRLNAQLQKSIVKNQFKNIESLNIGLGDEEKTIPIHVRKENMGGSSIGRYKNLDLVDTFSKEMIIIKTLDSVIGEKTVVNVIKIDVEGYEFEALRGAENILKRDHPIIFMEFSPIFYEYDQSGKSKELLAYLESFGYSFYTLEDKPIDLHKWLAENIEKKAQIDIICKSN